LSAISSHVLSLQNDIVNPATGPGKDSHIVGSLFKENVNSLIKETENNNMVVKYFQRSYTISDTKIADTYKKSEVDVLMECCIICALSVGTNSADLM
jgi:hypothetical protein